MNLCRLSYLSHDRTSTNLVRLQAPAEILPEEAKQALPKQLYGLLTNINFFFFGTYKNTYQISSN